MNLRPSGYEPDELPDCSTPRRTLTIPRVHRLAKRGRYPPGVRFRRRRRTSTELVVAPRFERALVAIASQTQQLDGRIERLERRLDDATIDIPTHDDLLEVRLHSARVSAELTRVAVELRSEIERQTTPDLRQHRLWNLAESIADLSDSIDTLPDDLHDRAATA